VVVSGLLFDSLISSLIGITPPYLFAATMN